MILASDTQYPWTAKTDAGLEETEKEGKAGGLIANTFHRASMLKLKTQVPGISGMILNGDITAFGHDWQLDTFKNIWGKLPFSFYPGLGNHDYANNVNDTFANSAAIRMVEYLREEVVKAGITNLDVTEKKGYTFPEVTQTLSGSFAYSWDIENVHFVQLNNYPLYATRYSGYNAKEARRKIIEVQASLDWLEKDLTKAAAKGSAIILNYHDSDEHWRDRYDTFTGDRLIKQFQTILTKYGVSAIFVGHYHEYIGKHTSSRLDSMYGKTPLLYCGSASQQKYLLATFKNNQMIVEKVDSSNGDAKRSLDGTYPLLTGRR